MLTESFGHETSDIVSRIQTSLLLVNLYLDNGMDINQIKDIKRQFQSANVVD